MKNIIGLLVIILIVSCKVQKPIKEIPVQYREVITTRLVPVINPQDSANITALFYCDSTNNVILKELSEVKSKNVNSQSSYNNGRLSHKFVTKHDTVYVTVTDTVKSKDIPVIVNVPFEVNKITGWQWFQIYSGRTALILLLLFIGWKTLKPKLLM